MNVAAQEVFRRLVEEELQIQSARVRQRHHEAGQSAAGTPDHDMSEVGPVGLSLLTGKHLQPEKCLPSMRAQAGHCAPQLYDAAAVTAIANHLVNARRSKAWMLVQRLGDE